MTSSLIKNARALRTQMTDAERILWRRLRAEQMGVKFRRQAPIDRYIVDFVCFSHKLVIEIDGGQHADCTSDRVRDAFLVSQGFKVLRFWNNEVIQQLDGVYETVRLALLELMPADSEAPLPNPSPQGGGALVRASSQGGASVHASSQGGASVHSSSQKGGASMRSSAPGEQALTPSPFTGGEASRAAPRLWTGRGGGAALFVGARIGVALGADASIAEESLHDRKKT